MAALNRLGCKRKLGKEWQNVCHHQLAPSATGCGHHGLGIFKAQGDGLFNKYILARFKGRNGKPGVVGIRHAEVHKIHFGIRQKLFKGLVSRHAGKVHLGPARAEVALNRCPVAGPLFRVARADGHHLRPRHSASRQIMGHAHKADAYNANADHCCISLAFLYGFAATHESHAWPVSAPALHHRLRVDKAFEVRGRVLHILIIYYVSSQHYRFGQK